MGRTPNIAFKTDLQLRSATYKIAVEDGSPKDLIGADAVFYSADSSMEKLLENDQMLRDAISFLNDNGGGTLEFGSGLFGLHGDDEDFGAIFLYLNFTEHVIIKGQGKSTSLRMYGHSTTGIVFNSTKSITLRDIAFPDDFDDGIDFNVTSSLIMENVFHAGFKGLNVQAGNTFMQNCDFQHLFMMPFNTEPVRLSYNHINYCVLMSGYYTILGNRIIELERYSHNIKPSSASDLQNLNHIDDINIY